MRIEWPPLEVCLENSGKQRSSTIPQEAGQDRRMDSERFLRRFEVRAERFETQGTLATRPWRIM